MFPAVGNYSTSPPLQAADPHRFGKLPAVFQTSLPVESCVRSPERQKSPKGGQHLPAMTGIPVRNLLPAVSPSLRLWKSKPSHPAKYVQPRTYTTACLPPGSRLQACGSPPRLVFTIGTAGVGHRQACRRTDAFPSLSYTEQGSRAALCGACLWDSNTTEAACAVPDSPEDNERSPAPLRLPGLETKRNRACSVLPSAVYLETAG